MVIGNKINNTILHCHSVILRHNFKDILLLFPYKVNKTFILNLKQYKHIYFIFNFLVLHYLEKDAKDADDDKSNSTQHEKKHKTPLAAGKWILVVRNTIEKHSLLHILRSSMKLLLYLRYFFS